MEQTLYANKKGKNAPRFETGIVFGTVFEQNKVTGNL